MTDILKIMIKGASGYVPIEEVYEDKLTITASSISYEYKPYEMSQSGTNIYRKWSYKTNSPVFREIYLKAAEMVPLFLYDTDKLFIRDIGTTEITVTYDDGHREKADYACPGEYFREWFTVIKKLVPETEYTPAVLLTSDDFTGEEDQ